jgi:hypothetical protein
VSRLGLSLHIFMWPYTRRIHGSPGICRTQARISHTRQRFPEFRWQSLRSSNPSIWRDPGIQFRFISRHGIALNATRHLFLSFASLTACLPPFDCLSFKFGITATLQYARESEAQRTRDFSNWAIRYIRSVAVRTEPMRRMSLLNRNKVGMSV